MIKLLLLAHILLGFSAVAYSLRVAQQSWQNPLSVPKNRLQKMWLSLAGVVTSGTILAVLTHAAFGKTCVSLTAFVLLTAFAQVFYSVSMKRALKQPIRSNVKN